MIDKRLMSDEDLAAVTGLQRYSKQCEWFRDRFGVEPVRVDNGRPIVTWAVFEALQARHFGVGAASVPAVRPALRPARQK